MKKDGIIGTMVLTLRKPSAALGHDFHVVVGGDPGDADPQQDHVQEDHLRGERTAVRDAAARRVSKTVNGVTTVYINNADWQEVAEYQGTAGFQPAQPGTAGFQPALVQSYVFGSYIDEPLCMVKADNSRFYYSTNDLYSVYALTDSNGTVVERYVYDPYGKATVLDANGTPRTVNESLYGNPWTFTGRRLDQETGLMQFRNRMYSTELGRFVGRDPIGYEDGYNLYAGCFVPRAVDPLGLWTEIVRNKENPWATVCSNGGGDSWQSLAVLADLDPAEYQNWVSNLDGSAVGPTPELDKTYRVPNTMLLVWLGEAGKVGRGWVKLGNDLKGMEADNLHVVTWMIGEDDGRIAKAAGIKGKDIKAKHFSDDLLNLISALSKSKQLYGWFSWSHGDLKGIQGPWGEAPWPYNNPPAKYKDINIPYAEIGKRLEYGLAKAVVHACLSLADKSEAKANLIKTNPNGRFWGHSTEFKASWVPGNTSEFGDNWPRLMKDFPSGGDLDSPRK